MSWTSFPFVFFLPFNNTVMFFDFYFLFIQSFLLARNLPTLCSDFALACRAQTGQSVWRAHPPFSFIHNPTLLQPCGKVAEQLFANQLTSPHPVLKEKLPRTATWLWRLADKGCVQHRCRAKKNILFDWHIWFISSQALGASLRLL